LAAWSGEWPPHPAATIAHRAAAAINSGRPALVAVLIIVMVPSSGGAK